MKMKMFIHVEIVQKVTDKEVYAYRTHGNRQKTLKFMLLETFMVY